MKKKIIYSLLPLSLAFGFVFVALVSAQYPQGYSFSSPSEVEIFTVFPVNGSPIIAYHSSSLCPVAGDASCAVMFSNDESIWAIRRMPSTNEPQRYIFGYSYRRISGRTCMRIRQGTTIYGTACTPTAGSPTGVMSSCTALPLLHPRINFEVGFAGDEVYIDNYFFYAVPSCPPVSTPFPTPSPSPTPSVGGGCDSYICTVEQVTTGGLCFNPSTGVTHTINLVRNNDFSVFPITQNRLAGGWYYHPLQGQPSPTVEQYFRSALGHYWEYANPGLFASYTGAVVGTDPQGACQDIGVRTDADGGFYAVGGNGNGHLTIYEGEPAHGVAGYEVELFDCTDVSDWCFQSYMMAFGTNRVTMCIRPAGGEGEFFYNDLMLIPVVEAPPTSSVPFLPNCNQLEEVESVPPLLPTPTIEPIGNIPTLPPIGTLPPYIGTPTAIPPIIVITPQATSCYYFYSFEVFISEEEGGESEGFNVCFQPSRMVVNQQNSFNQPATVAFSTIIFALLILVPLSIIRQR